MVTQLRYRYHHHHSATHAPEVGAVEGRLEHEAVLYAQLRDNIVLHLQPG
jgi:hypothetical protein